MRKTFRFRILPTKAQKRQMNDVLTVCCRIYNHFVDERKTKWENEKISVRMYDQQNSLPELRTQFSAMKQVYSQTLQNVNIRVDLAFQAFFRRLKAKEAKVGYPRFKSYDRYDSFTYPQYGNGCKVVTDNGKADLCLSKIGSIPIIYHREMIGIPKTMIVKRSPTGKWYVSISCEYEPQILPVLQTMAGADVGIKTFATMSDGSKIENPSFFKQEEKNLVKAQSKKDKLPKGSKERKHQQKAVTRIHERIKWRREDFCHQESRKMVNKYQCIFFEDLDIQSMQEKNSASTDPASIGQNKRIADVAWGMFTGMTAAKAEEAGRTVGFVNPYNTSQDCSGCGSYVQKGLEIRTHKCPKCGLVMDRDLNASLNILRRGTSSLGKNPRSLCL